MSALLTAANAERLVRHLSRMRGAAMKMGQLLSLEGEDFLPPEFSEVLVALRADADGMPEAQLEAVLRDELGASWDAHFDHFEREPMAAASIGQVHAAAARGGRPLAVKIQYPGIARSIDGDVDNLARALRLSRLLPTDVDLRALVAEAKRQLHAEADYLREADQLERYGALLADEPRVRVPGVDRARTTARVLAMDRLEGLPLEDLRGSEHPQARRDAAGRLLYELLLREIFEWRFTQSDPNLANYLWLPDEERLGLLDLGAGHEVPGRLARLYARLIVAAMDDDRKALEDVARAIGFVAPDERADRVGGVVDLLRDGAGAFAAAGPYDFAASDLPERLRARGLDLAFRRGFRRPPPAETLFLQRKLAGTFLLCARLRARVPLREIAEPIVRRAAAAGPGETA
jgi:predicted unusual protein kinase regulating ubiquinone biosynthesis (AarF/ABC1/UbiB family)